MDPEAGREGEREGGDRELERGGLERKEPGKREERFHIILL